MKPLHNTCLDSYQVNAWEAKKPAENSNQQRCSSAENWKAKNKKRCIKI